MGPRERAVLQVLKNKDGIGGMGKRGGRKLGEPWVYNRRPSAKELEWAVR